MTDRTTTDAAIRSDSRPWARPNPVMLQRVIVPPHSNHRLPVSRRNLNTFTIKRLNVQTPNRSSQLLHLDHPTVGPSRRDQLIVPSLFHDAAI